MRAAWCLLALGCAAQNPASPATMDLSWSDLAGDEPIVPTTDLAVRAPSDLLPATVVTHSILPSDTDSAISAPDDPHLTWSSGPGNGRLLIFLPGSGAVPSQYRLFLGFAASTGYHVIGLDYPNKSGTVNALCGNNLDCYPAIRNETYSGVDHTSLIDVSPADSIHNRLVKLLAYLVAQYPEEGWDPFLYMGEPGWNKIAVGGHSQGGGHAGWIASLEKVARVVMFSSLDDASRATTPPTPASWVGAHVTPSERYFGFDHQQDTTYRDKILAAWSALGMDGLGAMADVDQLSPPYAGTHELTASRALSSPHNQIVGDSTPVVNGVPVYQEAWRYLIGP